MTLGQDLNQVNTNFLQSMTNNSNLQAQIASGFTNLLSQISTNLSLSSSSLYAYGYLYPNYTTIQNFINEIQAKLSNGSVQLALVPTNANTFISNAYLGFYNNLVLNTGVQSNITDMNSLYYTMYFNPNATACITTYNNEYNPIYAKAATDFSKLIDTQVSAQPAQFNPLESGLKTAAQSLLDNFATVIGSSGDNQTTLLDGVYTFVNLMTLVFYAARKNIFIPVNN